jgi:DNA-binding IclR family transcriptional regulator
MALKKRGSAPASPRSTAMSSTLRCLQVLELLAEDPFELSLSALAERLALPRPSAHRLCTTLLEANLIEQNPETRRYILAPKALWVGSGYVRHSAVYRASFFPMQDLAKSVTGTVQLGVLDNGHVLFVHSVGYAGSPHAFADVGLRRSLHATASGKIFLAAMPWTEVEKVMSAQCDRYTDKTITSVPRMKQEIAEIQRKNYALNIEELLPGYWVLAAPVIGRDGKTLAAISLTLSTEHFSPDQEVHYAALVNEAAQKSSLQLGSRGMGLLKQPR